ncbi:hypothetical protein EVG20_g8184, partial [Dentipellis fragilis]
PPSAGHHGPSEASSGAAEAAAAAETPSLSTSQPTAPTISTPTIIAPAPQVPQAAAPAFAVPDRPQSPTLCKFGLKCTNAHCRWSHPSPVATPESGMVLSNEACEQGKNCKDKDCIKAHVSPAAVNPQLAVEQPKPHSAPIPASTPQSHVPCRPVVSERPARGATCPFQHPEGRVLPTTFHRGLSTGAPLVSVATPQTGSMGGASHHRSVTFNKPGDASAKETLERKMKEVEEKKSQAEAAVKEAENKKSDAKPAVAITA